MQRPEPRDSSWGWGWWGPDPLVTQVLGGDETDGLLHTSIPSATPFNLPAYCWVNKASPFSPFSLPAPPKKGVVPEVIL